MNQDTQEAWRYHNETKHSWESVRSDHHYLDWSNMPPPFKLYTDRPAIPLPGPEPMPRYPALTAIADSEADPNIASQLTISGLAQILHYSAGITRKNRAGTIAFRAAACAGALYPVEVYVVSRELDDLAAGVYHFNVRDHALVPLREGDCSPALDEAAGGLPAVAAGQAVLAFTAISWRSSWKYRSRSYRYHYWDNGTILANALAVCAALNLPAQLVMGFIDDGISRLVGIDGRRELPLSLLAVGSRPKADAPGSLHQLPELSSETVPASGGEIEYPLIPHMHVESSLSDGDEVRRWRGRGVVQDGILRSLPSDLIRPASDASQLVEARSNLIPLRPQSIQTLPTDSIGEVILRRASTRRFARKPISFEELSTILERSTRGIASDFAPQGVQLNDVYMIATRVDGLVPGAYYYRRDEKALELLKQGDFGKDGSYLTLEQDLGGDSSATLFYMVDLNRVLKSLGNRGYRSAQIESGIIGGKTYIAAYALGRGATGLTFYDDDVTGFFSPHASGKSCMLVMSIGVPGRRPMV